MKVKLTISVSRDLLAKARRKLAARNRSISAEVDELLARIVNETQPGDRPLWSELFGDIQVPLDLEEAESDTWHGKQLRKTAAYRAAKRKDDKRSSGRT